MIDLSEVCPGLLHFLLRAYAVFESVKSVNLVRLTPDCNMAQKRQKENQISEEKNSQLNFFYFGTELSLRENSMKKYAFL